MERLGSILAYLIIAVFVILLIAFIWSLYRAPATTSVAIMAALIAFSGALLSKHIEQLNAIKTARRVEQAELYSQFVEGLLRIPFSKDREDVKTRKLETFIREMMPKIIVRASPEFINAWLSFKESPDEENPSLSSLMKVARLLGAVRRDLGFKAGDISDYDLLRIFINDLPKLGTQESIDHSLSSVDEG